MSSFYQETIHPITGETGKALWLDDYFGRRQYGVKFESDGRIFRESELSDVKNGAVDEIIEVRKDTPTGDL